MGKKWIPLLKKKMTNLVASFSWMAALEVVTFAILGLLLWLMLNLYLG